MEDKGKNGIGWVGVVFVIILIALAYNHYTSKKINEDYGYQVKTSGITDKPDCASLEPQNPYEEGSGHFAGFEWGAEGKDCGGNSDSFVQGCQEYETQNSAYEYCLMRNK